ncbi:MAG: hypothetical protein FWE88_06835 [Phycisphaerae bacterium]|nr:hypothetical protein [Phycisphaerae bacterium]
MASKQSKQLALKTVAHQPSWVVRSQTVELALTRRGGHLAPVTFYRDSDSPVQPYHIAPWASEKHTKIPESELVLTTLRGDFLCMPFGGGKIHGKQALAHGETSTLDWIFGSLSREGNKITLDVTMDMKLPAGRVTKTLTLVDGHNVVYNTHRLEGFRATLPISHHATLRMPDAERTVAVSTSPFAMGLTFHTDTGDPANGCYQTLQPGQTFTSLDKVPTVFKSPAFDDCSLYPRQRGFCDLLGVFHKSTPGKPAWTAAVYTKENFLWFSLKDAAVLPCLSFWSENRGRWTTPWLGRNNCLGLEDGATYLPSGTQKSLAANPASQAGFATAMTLSPKTPTAIRYIQGVAKTPKGFDRVKTVAFGNGEVVFTADNGKKATALVNWDYLFTGAL